IGELLVVRRLERERPLPCDESAAARDRAPVEVDAQHEEAPAAEPRHRDLLEISAAALRAGQCRTAQTLPAPRLHLQELVDPALDVVTRSEREVLYAAALAKASLLAAEPAAHVARDLGLRIGLRLVPFAPQSARKGVADRAEQPQLVGHIDQCLVERAIP